MPPATTYPTPHMATDVNSRLSAARRCDEVELACLHQAFGQMPTIFVVNILVAGIVVWLFAESSQALVLTIWCTAVLIINALRVWLARAFFRDRNALVTPWRTLYMVGAALSGLTWGATGVLLTPGTSLEYEVVLAFVLGGMAAAAVPAMASVFRAYVIYLVTLLLPITLWFYTQPNDIAAAMGAMSLFYMLAMIALARNYANSTGKTLRLAHENNALIKTLTHANDSTAAANQLLAEEVEERSAANMTIRSSQSRFKDFAELGADLFWEVDNEFRYTHTLGQYQDVLGVPASALIGQRRDQVQVTDDGESSARDQHLADIAARRPFSDYVYAFIRPDGAQIMLCASGKPIYDEDGLFIGYRGVARNVTEAHTLSRQLRYQATHDALTGLTNRAELDQRLQRAIDQSQRESCEHVLCFMDLDQFKVVNDTCGHSAGDELLRQLAKVFTGHVRARDTLARLGGDEFGLLLEHCALDQARRVINDLHKAVGEYRFEWEGQAFHVGVSIGVVPITQSSGTLQQIMSDADSACYAAKEAGRNRVHVCSQGDATLVERHGQMQWVSRITRALEENRFRLFVQPIAPIAPIIAAKESVQLLYANAAEIAAETTQARTDHFEVLLRMIDEEGNLVSPGAFLPAAEHYNLSPKLDRWVVAATFEWLAGDPRRIQAVDLCSINLSGNTLVDDGFAEHVISELERLQIPPAKICFEITETAAISKLTDATRLISILRELGCRFALDDFGSGLSSFAYLKNLPVDYLKIDGLFIRDIVDDPIDLAMVKSINEVGQVMGKKTIAEFVENDQILTKLREIGVDFAQGYGIGKPHPIDELDW